MKETNPGREGFEKQTGIKLGKSLYQGDGEVFELKDRKDRLAKVVWSDNIEWAKRRLHMLKNLKKLNNGAVVKLYEVGMFESTWTQTFAPSSTGVIPTPIVHNEVYYYYVMDRVKHGVKQRDVELIESVIYEESYSKETSGRIRSFIKKARQIPYSYGDFHNGNIYVSKRGALKFIDLESFSI